MITRDLFFSLNNPVIFTMLFSVLLFGAFLMYYHYLHKPLRQKHALEKEILRLKNSRLMAMFAELDPEPLFRFNNEGKIIFTNESGNKIISRLTNNPMVTDLIALPAEFNYKNFIESGNTLVMTSALNGEFYDITVKGIPETGFGQIYCNDITIRKNAEEELQKSRKKLRELSAYIQKIQEIEKQNISRELHDNFGQILTSIKMNIQMLDQSTPGDSEKLKYSAIYGQLEKARQEIREISYRLRPRVLDDFGLVPALKMLCEDISRNSGIKGLFQHFNYTDRLNTEIETNIYRIVQEALNNMTKHSKASEFNVQLIRHDDKVIVSIDDDGVGFDQSARGNESDKSGMGMINMSERALSFNGSLIVNSSPGNGTEILIEIPIN